MDTILDGGSPRRGSLNSLHRQSSGSFSNTSRLAASLQASNNNNLSNLYKDLDKFTRYFIIKTVQVIVQSRIGESKRIKTDCKPNGNDWFNINITDIAEVSERTKAALDSDGLSIKTNWRVCCEISLKTNDGGAVVLEHWIISNKSNFNSSQNHLQTKLNNAAKSNQSCLRTGHLSTSNNSNSPLSAVNSSTTRVSPFSNKMRSRLNSINDCSGDSFTANKLLVGANNENFDIKSSTSCFSLATSSANHTIDNNSTTIITASPSTTSLSNNQTHGHSTANNNSTYYQANSKTSAISSIYTIYNRMSLLLKTLMTTTHIVPAYRLASRSSQTDSCVICYRVYTSPSSYQKPTNPMSAKGSIEDISYNNFNPESPNRRSSSSNSSFGSINIKDFVSTDELDHFCPILKLGSVKTDVNELEVSLCYRTDVKNSNHLMRSPRLRDNMYNKIMDEECITAAKQLLAGNESLNQHQQHERSDSITNGTNNNQELGRNDALDYIDQPLRPAFATKDSKTTDKNSQDPNLVIVEPAFEGLLQLNNSKSHEDLPDIAANSIDRPRKTKNQDLSQQPKSMNAQSEPIQVPTGSQRSKHVDLGQNLSSSSTPRSLTDSFVFVDLNPPFASDEQNDINSFFHGPSPAFSNGFDCLKDVDELTSQLADIEANASQLDEFVDNICVSEDEED